MACHQRLRLQDQVLMSLERHVQDRQKARERGRAPGMEGGVDAARPGQAWGPHCPRTPRTHKPWGNPISGWEQPALPSSPGPRPPQSGQIFSVAFSWGPERAPQALLSEGSRINSRLEAADAPPTSSGLADRPRAPQALAGGCCFGALFSPSPSSPPPEAAAGEEMALGLRDKLPSGQRPSQGFTVQCAADDRARAPLLLSRRRHLSGLSDPARGLRGSSLRVSAPASARPARILARTVRARWMPARRNGVPAPQAPECPPAGGQSLGTRVSGDPGSDRKRQRRRGSMRARTRTADETLQRWRTPEVRLPEPAPGNRANTRTLFPRSLHAP